MVTGTLDMDALHAFAGSDLAFQAVLAHGPDHPVGFAFGRLGGDIHDATWGAIVAASLQGTCRASPPTPDLPYL